MGGAGGVDGHGVGKQSGVDELGEVLVDEGESGGHEVGAVDEGEAFFGLEGEGGKVGVGEGLCAGDCCVVVDGLAFADHDLGDVGEGGQVAGCTDRAEFGDDGGDACVEHVEDLVDDLDADAGFGSAEGTGQDEHHGSDDFGIEGVADAGGVGADEVSLEIFEVVGGDAFVGKGTKAGVDAVVGEAVVEDGFEPGSALGDLGGGFVGEYDLSALASDGGDHCGGEGQVGDDGKCFHG